MSKNNYCENIVERRLRLQCKALGIMCEKIERRKWPDREIFWPGLAFQPGELHLVETKRPKKGKYEAGQIAMIKKLRVLGYTVKVLRTKEQVDIYIKACIRKFNVPISLLHRSTKAMSAKQFQELKELGLV